MLAPQQKIEATPMPAVIVERIEDFVARHHVERPFVKRRRDDAKPRAGVRRAEDQEDGE